MFQVIELYFIFVVGPNRFRDANIVVGFIAFRVARAVPDALVKLVDDGFNAYRVISCVNQDAMIISVLKFQFVTYILRPGRKSCIPSSWYPSPCREDGNIDKPLQKLSACKSDCTAEERINDHFSRLS